MADFEKGFADGQLFERGRLLDSLRLALPPNVHQALRDAEANNGVAMTPVLGIMNWGAEQAVLPILTREEANLLTLSAMPSTMEAVKDLLMLVGDMSDVAAEAALKMLMKEIADGAPEG